MSKYELETIQPGEARYYAVPPRKIAPLVTLLRKKTGNAYVVTKTGEGCRVIREGKEPQS
jgi:hypothetical protein